ncbi:MAG: hypothetical protein K2K74_17965 [Lachnospiraceae bacterium]|nr:hypothetical protein [Lachnospiraceae bacterium]
MSELVMKWDEFISALLNMLPELVKEPIVYAIIFLVVLVITALCSIPTNKNRVTHSVLGLISYSFKILLGFIGSILTAIESITNFIDVVRVILRGKLTEGTQFLLCNYAIVALSVASFYTTFNGLLQVSDWYISILITFGIQVGILAMSSRISLERNKGKARKNLRTVTYEWADGKQCAGMILNDDQIRAGIQKRVKIDEEKSLENEDEGKKKETIPKNLKYYLILFLCIGVSSYFSYVHFYEKLVHPGAPMDNYMTAMNMVSDIVSAYSSDLVEVQGVLQKYLQNYNTQVREAYAESIGIVQKKNQFQEELLERIQTARTEVMDIERDISELNRERISKENEEFANPGAQEIEGRTAEEIQDEIEILTKNRLLPAQEHLEELEDEYNERQKELNDESGYLDVQQLGKALGELDAFYVNPLYLNNEGISEELLLADLSALMEYDIAHAVIQEGESDAANEKYRNLSIVFNNYVGLSRYYAENENVGMNPIAIQEAQRNQEYIISEYQRAVVEAERVEDEKEKTEEAEDEKEETEETEDGNKRNPADILNNETAVILMQMIGELNRIPVMEIWSDIQEEEQRSLNKLANHDYNEKLYDLYRISSGNISIMEEAVRIRGSKRLIVGLLMVVMALFVDIMTFVLTITKSADNYENKLPLLRKIIYTIFFTEGLSEVEKHLVKVRRWVGGMSLAIGMLLFIVYDIVTESKNNATKAAILVIMVMGCVLAGYLLIYVYERVCESRMHWKNEKAYKELMCSLDYYNVKREDALRKKLDECIDSGKELTLDTDKLKKLCELLDTSELEEDQNILTHRAKCLLKDIEIKLLLRITMESQYADRGVSTRQLLKAGWHEYVYMAVLKEDSVRTNYYSKEFAVLKSRELVYCVKEKEKNYYVLSDLLMKILYDLIMEENSGSVLDAELSFAEHISDYYEEQEIL